VGRIDENMIHMLVLLQMDLDRKSALHSMRVFGLFEV